jgi:hypothetical protein
MKRILCAVAITLSLVGCGGMVEFDTSNLDKFKADLITELDKTSLKVETDRLEVILNEFSTKLKEDISQPVNIKVDATELEAFTNKLQEELKTMPKIEVSTEELEEFVTRLVEVLKLEIDKFENKVNKPETPKEGIQ